jgi:integrase
MARTINRLTSKGVDAIVDPGLHADGAGLYLRIDQTLARRWVFVYVIRGRRREMGLGSAGPNKVSLKDARSAADAARRLLSQGADPIEERRRGDLVEMTFGQLATRVIADLAPGWRSDKAAPQWTASLETHARKIWKRPVGEIGTDDVVAVLTPIWQTIPETATRVRARIERVLDVARIEGRRSGDNPARWRGHLQLILPKQVRARGHHRAAAYEDVPAFVAALRQRTATAARALEFAILAAARTTEVREAVWAEIDGDVWTIPAARTKTGKAHRVPLTAPMLAVLESVRDLRTSADLIFPGDQRIEPLSRMAMLMLLRRMDAAATVHGFRSAFRDWAGDQTSFPRDVAEEALGHVVGGAVERAYRRRDALDKRRKLMKAWADYLAVIPQPKVVAFPRKT